MGALEVAVVRYAPNRLLRLLFPRAVAPKDMSRLMLGHRDEITEIGNGSGNGSGIEEEIAIDVGRDLLTDAGEATTTITRGRIEPGAEGTGMNGIGLEIGPLVLEIGRGSVPGQGNRLGTVQGEIGIATAGGGETARGIPDILRELERYGLHRAPMVWIF